MSEELEYLKARFSDVMAGQQRLESKLDAMRDEQVTQRSEISTVMTKLSEHDRILLLGNGQKPLTVQVAETNTRLEDLENDAKSAKTSKAPKVDASKERAKLWTAAITVLGLVVSQISMWFFGVPGK